MYGFVFWILVLNTVTGRPVSFEPENCSGGFCFTRNIISILTGSQRYLNYTQSGYLLKITRYYVCVRLYTPAGVNQPYLKHDLASLA